MNEKRIAELQNFKTQDFSDCPVQTPEQLQEFKPKYPDARLYEDEKIERKIGILDGKVSIKFQDDFAMTAEELCNF